MVGHGYHTRLRTVLLLTSNFFHCGGIILIVWFFAGISPVLADEVFAPKLCVLPVKGSTVEAARALVKPGEYFIEGRWASLTLANTVKILPGVPKPILYPWSGIQHVWTVSQDDRFEELDKPFPSLALNDRFAVEAETGRVVGAGWDGIYAFDSGTGQFRLIVPAYHRKRGDEIVDPSAFYNVRTIVHLARLGMTLIGTDNGVFQLIGETVHLLDGAGQRELGPVMTIIDLPVHKAIVLAGDNFDMAGGDPGAMLRHDDGTVERLASISKGPPGSGDYVMHASESRQPGRIILRTAKTLMEVEMRPSPAGFSPSRSSTLMSSPGNLTLKELTTRSGEYLILNRRVGWFGQQGLERLESDGLHTVPGATVNVRIDSMRKLDAFKLVIITGEGSRYSYDGNQVVPFQSAVSKQIGPYEFSGDLPSIETVVLRAEHDLFGLTKLGQLERLRLPVGYDGGKSIFDTSISDFPTAHIGLIATQNNLYALDRSGDILPIRGGHDDEYSYPFAGEIPGRGMMLVLGKSSLHLIATGIDCDATPEGSIH